MRSSEVGTVGQAILDAIRAAGPEATLSCVDIGEMVKKSPNAVSGHMSTLYRKKLVGRMPTTTSDGRTSFLYSSTMPKAEKVVPAKHRKAKASAKVGVLITLQVGRKETITLSYKDAAEVYEYLKEIFERS